MALSNGQLLIVHRRVTLGAGATTVDTGITQLNLAVDPPLGGSASIASRVMVVPMAPYPSWDNVTHGEPFLSNNTVNIAFDNSGGSTTINIMIFAPATFVGPIDADLYEINCQSFTVVTVDNLAVAPPAFQL
jgi:hypothetical protein